MSEAGAGETTALRLPAAGRVRSRPGAGRLVAPLWRFGPIGLVLASCTALLVLLRSELVQVPYLNDSAMAEEMVRFALGRIRHGHFPPTSWFPYLNLGSPQFLHYQSLGAMLTALLAWPLGVGRAFTLVVWLLIGLWPLLVYWAARIFGLAPAPAALAAALAPFLSSFTGVGYEQIGYTWAGYGLFSQLFAMWTLPLAWALSWRAVDEGRFVLPASLAVAATAAFHFETGYLAFAVPLLFAAVQPRRLVHRVLRAGALIGGAGLLCAWVIVPLVAEGKWAAINQFLQEGPDARSYGAGRVLSALLGGGVLDWHHFPVVSILAGLGLASILWPAKLPLAPELPPLGRQRRAGLALVFLFCASLVLFIGPASIHLLLQVVPGGRDLFFRRFVIGVQLAALLLAGYGSVALFYLSRALFLALGHLFGQEGRVSRNAALLTAVLLAASMADGWLFAGGLAATNSALVSLQASQSARLQASQLGSLLRLVRRGGGGRVFAGDPSDYGANFFVGEVPVFKYLAAREVDEVGFTLRTASLMSDPEVYFDASNPADYRLFAVRWLLYPAGTSPLVAARRVAGRGSYVLYELPRVGYLQLVQTRGHLRASSGDLATFAEPFLRGLPSVGAVYPTVAYEGAPPAPPLLAPAERPSRSLGRIISERADLPAGRVSAVLVCTRRCVVLLSASYDPGWVARVDGRRVRAEMIEPALVGLVVGRGRHDVSFSYGGYPDYPLLFGLGLLGLGPLFLLDRSRLLADAPQRSQGAKGDRHRSPDAHQPEERHAEQGDRKGRSGVPEGEGEHQHEDAGTGERAGAAGEDGTGGEPDGQAGAVHVVAEAGERRPDGEAVADPEQLHPDKGGPPRWAPEEAANKGDGGEEVTQSAAPAGPALQAGAEPAGEVEGEEEPR